LGPEKVSQARVLLSSGALGWARFIYLMTTTTTTLMIAKIFPFYLFVIRTETIYLLTMTMMMIGQTNSATLRGRPNSTGRIRRCSAESCRRTATLEGREREKILGDYSSA
jgi:hypothetical protein